MTPAHAHLAEAHRLMEQGLTAVARVRLESIVSSDPNLGVAHAMLGVCLAKLGEPEPAAVRLARAVELGVTDPQTLCILGEVLRDTRQYDHAVTAFRRALAQRDDTITRLGLAQALQLAKRYEEVIAECRATLAPERRARTSLEPAVEAQVLALLAWAQERIGRAEEAVETYRAAIRRDPANPLIAGGLCVALNYASGCTAAEVRAAHESYARLLEGPDGRRWPPMHRLTRADGPAPGRPLRVGIMSPDLRRHAVACFLLPLLEHLDPARVEVYLYSSSAIDDEATRRFRARARVFRTVVRETMSGLARTVASDRVHVLIETAGHTLNTRLPVLPLRPAPVQALYLGYPATTGMKCVDWRIVDSASDPPGTEDHSTERLWRLDPCHLAYRPLSDPPAPEPAPPSQRDPGAPFTFGSFSAVPKITEAVLPAWVAAVGAVPGSRLLLKHEQLGNAGTRADLRARLEAAGLGPERLVIEEPEPGKAGGLMPHYARVDVALDTFPYSGTTTVCEALSMGVPVVARPGETTASRASMPILAAAGLRDLAADTTEGFVRLAAGLAGDPARLAALRRELPGRFTASPACDGRGLASRFADMLHAMWEQWASNNGR